jgi:hypothetical protein
VDASQLLFYVPNNRDIAVKIKASEQPLCFFWKSTLILVWAFSNAAVRAWRVVDTGLVPTTNGVTLFYRESRLRYPFGRGMEGGWVGGDVPSLDLRTLDHFACIGA